MLETCDNIESGIGGRTDKFPRQMLQKWTSVPRLLLGIVVMLMQKWARDSGINNLCQHNTLER